MLALLAVMWELLRAGGDNPLLFPTFARPRGRYGTASSSGELLGAMATSLACC